MEKWLEERLAQLKAHLDDIGEPWDQESFEVRRPYWKEIDVLIDVLSELRRRTVATGVVQRDIDVALYYKSDEDPDTEAHSLLRAGQLIRIILEEE